MSVWRVAVLQSSGQGPVEDEDVLENRELGGMESRAKSQKGHTPREKRAQRIFGQVRGQLCLIRKMR